MTCMKNAPQTPRSTPVFWFFLIVAALTLALGIVAMFKSR